MSLLLSEYMFDTLDRASKSKLIIKEISSLFNKMIDINMETDSVLIEADLFTAKKITKISIKKYIKRLNKYFNFEISTLILALIYIDKICETNNIKIKFENFHRIFLISLIIAIKYLEDLHYSNDFYANIGGITLNELNELEVYFLKKIDFCLFIHQNLFVKYKNYAFKMIKSISSIL